MTSLSIITDVSINSLDTITASKVAEVNRIPDIFFQYVLKTNEENKRPKALSDKNILNLSNRLHQLNQSVEDYANLCFIWKIIGIFTGTLWNYLRLKNTLKDIRQVVDAVANPIRKKKNSPLINTPSHPPLIIPINNPPVNWNTPIVTPPSPPITPQPPPVPKPAPIFLTKSERIQRKITLVTAAGKLASDQLEGNIGKLKTTDNRAAIKADAFFKKTLQKLQNGIDAPLPRWFHATGNKDKVEFASVTNIIQDKVLKQSSAPAGYGTYFSTCDEYQNYGPWTFAIDEKEFEGTEGFFFPAEGTPAPGFLYAALWVRVLKDIPVTSESVAFMVAAANKTDALRKQILANNLDVDVLTREEASTVYMYLELADETREKPSNLWEPNTSDTSNRIHLYNLPDNMRHKGWPRLRASYT